MSECPLTKKEVRHYRDEVRAACAGDSNPNIAVASAIRRAARMAAVRVLDEVRERRIEMYDSVMLRYDAVLLVQIDDIRSRYAEEAPDED